jgi:hypothetical protein
MAKNKRAARTYAKSKKSSKKTFKRIEQNRKVLASILNN